MTVKADMGSALKEAVMAYFKQLSLHLAGRTKEI
jgi:hypothetical protein